MEKIIVPGSLTQFGGQALDLEHVHGGPQLDLAFAVST